MSEETLYCSTGGLCQRGALGGPGGGGARLLVSEEILCNWHCACAEPDPAASLCNTCKSIALEKNKVPLAGWPQAHRPSVAFCDFLDLIFEYVKPL